MILLKIIYFLSVVLWFAVIGVVQGVLKKSAEDCNVSYPLALLIAMVIGMTPVLNTVILIHIAKRTDEAIKEEEANRENNGL